MEPSPALDRVQAGVGVQREAPEVTFQALLLAPCPRPCGPSSLHQGASPCLWEFGGPRARARHGAAVVGPPHR